MTEWRYAQGEPEYVFVVLQDHGPDDGGWGPATLITSGWAWPKPLITTRSNKETIAWFYELAAKLADETGKPTKVVRFKRDEDLASYGGSS